MTPVEYLKSVGINIQKIEHTSYKLKAEGFMDLTVETWPAASKAKSWNVSMCHYGEQNGDLMKDPDILFQTDLDGSILYREYQNDYANYYSENHKEAKDFMENTWIPNLLAQGHKLVK